MAWNPNSVFFGEDCEDLLFLHFNSQSVSVPNARPSRHCIVNHFHYSTSIRSFIVVYCVFLPPPLSQSPVHPPPRWLVACACASRERAEDA